jgi:hypothetical protein
MAVAPCGFDRASLLPIQVIPPCRRFPLMSAIKAPGSSSDKRREVDFFGLAADRFEPSGQRRSRVRQNKNLNNVVEQDHRAIGSSDRPSRSFAPAAFPYVTARGSKKYKRAAKSRCREAFHFANMAGPVGRRVAARYEFYRNL